MTDAYSLLNRELRFYIHEKGWPSLTRIQNASIKAIYGTDNNLILSAATASGKTEAAFLPTISKVSSWDSGVKIVYISPLIALINDQFKRITDMCFDMNIPITSWHGEASKSKKNSLIESPRGILLITPESIEAMLSGKPEVAKILFRDVQYIIVDEIHSFLSGNRGLQLKSLLGRMLRYSYEAPRMLGLSATIGEPNYQLAKDFFINGRDTNIIVDKSSNELEYTFDLAEPINMSNQYMYLMYEYSKEGSMLIFPNSREKVELIASGLRHIIEDNGDDTVVFAHHSSVSKIRRQEIEEFAKEAKNESYIIVATSTLELGIDIGSVASVVQFGSPNTVLSLAQRLGRSGRKTKKSILHQISHGVYDAIQAMAAISLFEEGVLDEIEKTVKAYDVFAHQVLSVLLENYGLSIEEYKYLNKTLATFSDITDEEFEMITDHLEENGFIEILEDEVITGMELDKLMYMGRFYNQFLTAQAYAVYNESGKIGEIELRPEIQEEARIILAGSVRKIDRINRETKKIRVSASNQGAPPKFLSAGAVDISPIIRERMRFIIDNPNEFEFDDETKPFLMELHKDLKPYKYPISIEDDYLGLMTFKGTKVNRTLAVMFNVKSKSNSYFISEADSMVCGPDTGEVFEECRINPVTRKQIFNFLKNEEGVVTACLTPYKYMMLVPFELRIEYIINNLLDLKDTYEYLEVDIDEHGLEI